MRKRGGASKARILVQQTAVTRLRIRNRGGTTSDYVALRSAKVARGKTNLPATQYRLRNS